MKSQFAVPETTIAEHYNIATSKGRSALFNKRLDELMKPKDQGGPGLTIDQAVHELRISQNPDDQKLLEAMGEAPSSHRTEKLQQEKWRNDMTKLADQNAKGTEPSTEIKAATARNSRSLAFNAKIDELTAKGLSLDQAINAMRANTKDASLLTAMGAHFTS